MDNYERLYTKILEVYVALLSNFYFKNITQLLNYVQAGGQGKKQLIDSVH